MIALRVSHNGNEICTAGIGALGVISTHVTWVHSERFRNEETRELEVRTNLDMQVGGLHTPSNKHRTWNCPSIQVGDVVQVQIVESDIVTPHDDEYGMSRESEIEREKQHLRDRAKDFGWKIIEDPDLHQI
jgi:hypothetical protein